MQVSGWLYLSQQGLAALCLLVSLGHAARLGRMFPLRLVLTALLSALGSLLSAWEPGLRGLMLPLVMLSPLAAWPGIPRRMRLPLSLMHTALALLLAGCARLAHSLPPPRLPALPLCCGMLLLLPSVLRAGDAPECVSIAIRYAARRLTLTALVDSGNLLRDPITGLPVIVISRRAAARLLTLPRPGELREGMRLMRIRTVAGPALMTLLHPQSVFLSRGRAWEEIRAMVGLSPDGYEGFQALVPSSLLRGEALSSITLDKEEISP